MGENLWEVVTLDAGTYTPHIHQHTPANFHLVYGEGVVYLRRREGFIREARYVPYLGGERMEVPAATSHGFYVTCPTVFLSVQLEGKRIMDTTTNPPKIDFVDDVRFQGWFKDAKMREMIAASKIARFMRSDELERV